MRFFSGHFHRLAILGLAEVAVVVFAVYAAIVLRYPGESTGFIETAIGPVWVRALASAGVVLLGNFSMGLYQLRKRASVTGVLARLMIAVAASIVALQVISYVIPSIAMGWGVIVAPN